MNRFTEDLYAFYCYLQEVMYMYVFKTMVPIYGYLILSGNWVLTKEEETEGKKAIPKRYIELVAEWLAVRDASNPEE